MFKRHVLYNFSFFTDNIRRARSTALVLTIFFIAALIPVKANAEAALVQVDERVVLDNGQPAEITVEAGNDLAHVKQVIEDGLRLTATSALTVVETDASPAVVESIAQEINLTDALKTDHTVLVERPIDLTPALSATNAGHSKMSAKERKLGAVVATVRTGISSYVYIGMMHFHPLTAGIAIGLTGLSNYIFATTDLDRPVVRAGHNVQTWLAKKLGLTKWVQKKEEPTEISRGVTWFTYGLVYNTVFLGIGASTDVIVNTATSFSMSYPWDRTFERWRENGSVRLPKLSIRGMAWLRQIVGSAIYPFILFHVGGGTPGHILKGMMVTGLVVYMLDLHKQFRVKLGRGVQNLFSRFRALRKTKVSCQAVLESERVAS